MSSVGGGRIKCDTCGKELAANGYGFYVRKSGWSERRRKGGTNALAYPETHDEHLCRECKMNLDLGIAGGRQGTLL